MLPIEGRKIASKPYKDIHHTKKGVIKGLIFPPILSLSPKREGAFDDPAT